MHSPSYEYHATAIGLGGVIRRGDRQTIIPSVASVALAAAGGEASTSVENYHRDGISFTRAESRVAGYAQRLGKTGGVTRHYTYADVFLTNLRIFDRLKIALMQATMTSTRDIETGHPLRELQPNRSRFSIRLLYRGIEIDGREIETDVDLDLCHAGTYDEFMRLLGTRSDLLSEETKFLAGLTPALPGDAPEDAPEDPAAIVAAGRELLEPLKRPPVSVPLVTIGPKGKKETKVKVPNFGTARFGHTLIKPDRQRLSLLRLNLDSFWRPSTLLSEPAAEEERMVAFDGVSAFDGGSGDGGTVTSGENGSNGVPIWE